MKTRRTTSAEGLGWNPGTVTVGPHNVVTGFEMNNLVAEVLDDESPRVVKTKMFGLNAAWQPIEPLGPRRRYLHLRSHAQQRRQGRFVVAGIPEATGDFSTNAAGLAESGR